jgi:sulfite reductase alpha subunit-like flavoprotein
MWPNAAGKLMVICGARTLEDLPFSQTLQKYTQAEFRRELAFSRAISGDRQYVQDRLLLCAPEILWLLRRPKSHMYRGGSG